MTQDITADDIDSTIVFDTDNRFAPYEDRDLHAEGVHERGNRKVVISYVLEDDADHDSMLRVHEKFYLDGELQNEHEGGTWPVNDGEVQHGPGHELDQFISDNFHADPELTLTEAFESMVVVDE